MSHEETVVLRYTGRPLVVSAGDLPHIRVSFEYTAATSDLATESIADLKARGGLETRFKASLRKESIPNSIRSALDWQARFLDSSNHQNL